MEFARNAERARRDFDSVRDTLRETHAAIESSMTAVRESRSLLALMSVAGAA
jgi:hypothetical protein